MQPNGKNESYNFHPSSTLSEMLQFPRALVGCFTPTNAQAEKPTGNPQGLGRQGLTPQQLAVCPQLPLEDLANCKAHARQPLALTLPSPRTTQPAAGA